MSDNPNVKHYTADDVRRIKEIMKEGSIVLQEVQDLQEGLRETVKSIAEEIDVKPGQLNKAIKIAFKQNLTEEQDKFDEVVDLLETAGRGTIGT